ncbi:lipoprotein insertase outer membrane protein LolB [Endozoicomonas sp.]|uniref:lipoprotein insertase outer membrane protein LolB n=1 Tax=Endozoicomonas sp. TaxID=1892382 RepID=UPI002887EB2C|nr:lipoprotein insertase outer membrane protein LolB [Endozoicomonas sp.]
MRLAFVFILFVLSGCATRSVDTGGQVSYEEREQRWQANQKRLNRLQTWQMTGRLNLKVPDRSGTMSVDWRQQSDRYKLFLDGPFGASIARISGDHQGVSVTASDETRYGPSPELLLYSLTGWQFPVSHLRFWIKGLPAPGGDARITLNDLGYPEKIKQAGWDIVYQQYGLGKGQRLPTRLVVSKGDVRLSLVVNNWQF